MKNFIVTHSHRFGDDVFLLQSHRELGMEDAIKHLDNFEPDREDEFVEIKRVDPEVIE